MEVTEHVNDSTGQMEVTWDRWWLLGTDGSSILYILNIFQNIDAILQLTPPNPIIEFSKSLYLCFHCHLKTLHVTQVLWSINVLLSEISVWRSSNIHRMAMPSASQEQCLSPNKKLLLKVGESWILSTFSRWYFFL